jgi:hypothetical protein
MPPVGQGWTGVIFPRNANDVYRICGKQGI